MRSPATSVSASCMLLTQAKLPLLGTWPSRSIRSRVPLVQCSTSASII